MAQRICPYCYKPFELSKIEFRCTNPKCGLERDEKESEHWGSDRFLHYVAPAKKKMFGGKPDYGICPSCGQKSFKVICPNCHNQIPAHMVEEGGKIISIIGAQSSGKTVFVSILIEELMKYGYKLGNIAVLSSSIADNPDESTQYRYNEEFYNPIYREGRLPLPTPKEVVFVPPLIFELCQKGHPSVFLVFYDNAGENFQDVNRVESYADYLNNSDAFICLVDVLQIENVRKRINFNDPEYKIHDRDFGFVANKIYEYCTSGQGQKNKSILNKPMAMVFNKFDYVYNNPDKFNLRDISGIGVGRKDSYFKQNGANGVNLGDLVSVHEGIKTFLTNECMPQASQFLSVMDNRDNKGKNDGFTNVKFFGVSPLGGEPVDGSIANLNPFRVLDPLVWALNEVGYHLNIVN